MEYVLLVVGKTDDSQLALLMDRYRQRLQHYGRFSIDIIPDLKNRKNLREDLQKNEEGQRILKIIKSHDYVVLLDEKGKQYDSLGFADWVEKKQHIGIKRCVFVVGGPYGFSEEIYQRAQEKIALSKMTFSHQMVRLFFVEQLYRAHTIIHNEPYHHQ